MSRIKAVIFDLDNTLIDFLRFKRVSLEAAVDAMIDAGLELPKEEALALLQELMEQYGYEHSEIFQKFQEKVLGRIDYRMLAYAVDAYRKARIGVLSPYPGTKRALLTLKERGLRLAIVTDAPKLKAWLRLTAMKIDDFFDVVVALEDTGREKPSRLPFKAALKELGVEAGACIMVGDRPEKDMKGAAQLGMKTCFAKYGGSKARGNWDYELESIKQLPDIL